MVLRPKTWKSRSPPGQPSHASILHRHLSLSLPPDAGWSSPVARQAHNLKVVGSNPTPATTDNSAGSPAGPAFVLLRARLWEKQARVTKIRHAVPLAARRRPA